MSARLPRARLLKRAAARGAALPLTAACLTAGCAGEEPVHASLLSTPAQSELTPTPEPIPLDEEHWTAFLTADEPWLSADTQINMITFDEGAGVIVAYLYHKDGTLVAGGVDIPTDTWLAMEGRLITSTNPDRLTFRLEDYGHSLSLDVDLLSNASVLSGYFTVDDAYEVWAEFYQGWWLW